MNTNTNEFFVYVLTSNDVSKTLMKLESKKGFRILFLLFMKKKLIIPNKDDENPNTGHTFLNRTLP